MQQINSSCLGALLLLLLPASVIAGPIPELLPSDIAPGLRPAPILPQFPPQVVHPYVEPPYSPGPPELVSGIRYYFGRGAERSGLPAHDLEDRPDGHVRDSALIDSFNMSADTPQDVEPSVIAINKNGTVWTTTVYTQKLFPSPGTELPSNFFVTTPDFSTRYKGQLALPAGYQWSGDPFLAANPYPSGVAPGRIYASGIVFNPPQGLSLIPSGIAVWYSDDGGRTWSNPTLVAEHNDPNFPQTVLDKPAIAVSWHQGSLGHVYVVYVKARNAINEIWIAKSTDGGASFGNLRLIMTGAVQGSQVLVNPFYGHVYVLWTDFNAQAIKMSTSLDAGLSWSMPENATSIKPIPGDPPRLNGSRAFISHGEVQRNRQQDSRCMA